MSTPSSSASRSEPVGVSPVSISTTPQAALATIMPIVEDQGNFIKNYANLPSPEHLRNLQKAAQQHGLTYEIIGPDAREEDTDWLGGVHGLLQFIARKRALRQPFSLKGRAAP